MKSDTAVAKRYGGALFEAARQHDLVQSVEDDLNAITGLIENDPNFKGFLYSPRIAREEKAQIAERLFSDRITALSMQALRLLLEKRRETDFNAIREEFVRLRREHGNVLYALVTSAKPLDPAMTDRLIAKLREKTGKTVEADFRVDPTLLGGIRVAYGNYVLDGSVRGSLNRVRDILKYDLLKQT